MILLQYKNILIFFVLFNIHSIYAQPKLNYNITGNAVITNDIYIQWIGNNLGKNTNLIISKIGNELKKRGFYNYEIYEFSLDTNISKDSVFVKLNLFEGSQTKIRNVYITNLHGQDSIFVSNSFNFLKNEIFIELELENKINAILTNFENSGYPFVSVEINSLVFGFNEDSNGVVDINLGIYKDELWKIDKVEISGNSKTKNQVIINAIRLEKGELYSQKRIDEIPVYINRLRFFENISTPTYYVNSKKEGILQIKVVEKNTNLFDGILGYVPSTQNGESGYLTGFVNINLRNLFGTGRSIGIKWKQENTLTQELELKYLEPWILSYPFNLNLHFFQRKQDSSYVKRVFGGDLEFLATENISASLILESESVIPSINNANLQILNSTSINTGIKLKVDYRDDIISPRSGIYFASTYKYNSKSISEFNNLTVPITNTNLNYHDYELEFGVFYSPFQNQVLALSINAKELIGDNFDISDYFKLGGTNSLRGYRENQFLGNRIIWSNLEYRFLLSQTSYLFGFYDSGYFLISENKIGNIKRNSNYKNGYGLGISLDTALGIMKISYAFAEGTSISDGLIHFGLLNEF